MSWQYQLIIYVSWRCEIQDIFLTLYCVTHGVVLIMTCTANKRNIVIPWAVEDVTVGKAPPFLTAHYTEVGMMFTMVRMPIQNNSVFLRLHTGTIHKLNNSNVWTI